MFDTVYSFFVFYILRIIVLYCSRPSIVLFSYSVSSCKSVLLGQWKTSITDSDSWVFFFLS